VSVSALDSTTSPDMADLKGSKMNDSAIAARSSVALLVLLAAALMTLVGPGSAQAALQFSQASIGLSDPPLIGADGRPLLNPDDTFVETALSRQAGAHPDLTLSFSLPIDGNNAPLEAVRDIDLDLPKGLVGNPAALPTCSPSELSSPGQPANCTLSSQVGIAELSLRSVNGNSDFQKVAVFNLSHGPDVPARFGFNYSGALGLITARVRPGDYGISSGSFSIAQAEAIEGVRITLWGVPADPSHDSLRQDHILKLGGPVNGPSAPYLNDNPGLIKTDASRVPFLTSPRSCSEEPVSFTLRGDSWEHPGEWDERVLSTDGSGAPFSFEGCERLPFKPSIEVGAQVRATDAPTGLKVDLTLPQPQDPDGFATADVRRVKMTLPEGMSVSPSSAAGLGACSLSEIGLGSNAPPSCPQSSKLGTVEIDTPLLDETLVGDVILAKQNDNPFGSLLALYISVKGPGFYLKLPGKVDLDPGTGQVTATFDNQPQLPFEDLRLEMLGGPRAALVTPPKCGTYVATTEFVSWASDTPVIRSTPMTFDQGCGTGGFDPRLRAGSESTGGGRYAAFNLQVTRADGEADLARIEATLPEGLLAKLAGVPLCGDAQAATGDCPAGSQVGSVTVGAGPGPLPIYVPEAGKAPTAAYLAGPYKGAPYSLVVKVPAQAGPFDLGTVLVRNALNIDPSTTQVTAKSDPLPQILQGIPIGYRDVRVEVNRPGFTVNPTSCRAMKVTSVLTSATGQTASPSSPFQVTGCGELGFDPSLKISLKGKMNRTGNPAVKAVLKAPKGQANIAKTTVVLPKSEFIDNAHINNPCTRVQFNANECPAGSILGHATAYTPLLDKPLSGPVYFRSNGGDRELPDLVADLKGQIHVTLVGFIDTAKSGGVRTRFADVPDAPVSKFVLSLKGGKKGLIENSENLCTFTPRAKVQMTGQNGKTANSNLKLGTSCGKGKRSK
jgi:hypothetical protein